MAVGVVLVVVWAVLLVVDMVGLSGRSYLVR